MSPPNLRSLRGAGLWALAVIWLASASARADTFVVGRDAPDLAATLERAQNGDVVEVPEGTWRGPVVLDRAITLRGRGGKIDGGGKGRVITVLAPAARVEGLTIFNSGDDVGGPDACVYVAKSATGAVIRGNRLHDCAFGIWIHETDGAQIVSNHVRGQPEMRVADRGNGIHLFNASHLLVKDNDVQHARDGIYVSATEDSHILGNRTDHQRFGIHYMFSYRNTISGNQAHHNTIGIALMESLHLVVEENVISHNERNGLLFRDVQYTKIRRNRLEHNGFGLFFYSSTENTVHDNYVAHNEVGLKVWAGTRRNEVSGNRIIGNRQQVFYVGSEDQIWGEQGVGNFWSDYLGWDQDGDGIGDLPYRLDSFTSNLLYRYPAAALLMRSPALEMLAHLSRRMPMMRVSTIVDVAPMVSEVRP